MGAARSTLPALTNKVYFYNCHIFMSTATDIETLQSTVTVICAEIGCRISQ